MLRRGIQLVLLAAAAAVTGCHREQPPMAPPKPPEVVVTRPVVQEVADFEEFTGRTESVEAVEVRARVSGYLDKMNFKEGADVKKGDLLFEIDPRPLKAELERAVANVGQAEARVSRLQADYQRARRMLGTKSIGQEEFEKISGDLAEAQSAVKASVAARDMANLNLDYSRVVSPINGRIGRRMIDPGNMVKADETALTYIARFDPMYAYFDVDERTYLRLYRYFTGKGITTLDQMKEIPVFLGLSDEEGFPHEGRFNYVDTRVDPNTGSVWVRGVFPNPKNLLSPGLFVRVRLPVGDPHQALLIPERALATDQGQKFVYVVNDKNEAVYRRLQVGPQHGQLRVVEKGVEPGERLIVSGLQRVRPGVKVEPKEEEKTEDRGQRTENGGQKSEVKKKAEG
jgi:RND family efflux transporter MFP subunit